MGERDIIMSEEKGDTPPSYGESKAQEAAMEPVLEPQQPVQAQAEPSAVTVVTQQPQMMIQQPMMMQQVQLRPWSRSICQCDCGTCCKATFCHCCVGQDIAIALNEDGCMWCCLYYFFCCWTPCFVCSQRS